MTLTSFLRRACLALPLAAAALRAQGTRPAAASAIWLTYNGEHAISHRLALLTDVQVRRDGDFGQWRQLLLRGGIGWAATPRLHVAGGYGYLRSYPTESLDIPEPYPEHRLWQMAQLTQSSGALSVLHRARLEERWVADAFTVAPRRWAYATRGRYLLRLAVPVPGTDGRFSLATSDEIFASVIGHTAAADQNRFTVGVGSRLSPTLRVELGYLNRAAIDGRRMTTRDHALLVAFSSVAPLRRDH